MTDQIPHCEGPPRVTGWRVGNGTAYAVVVCACGKQAEFIEVERQGTERVGEERVKYRTILADPPWPYKQQDVAGSRQRKINGDLDQGVSSSRRYGAMTINDLCGLPIKDIAADDAHLYLWSTNAFIVEAHQIARAWGFAPKTILTWVKVKDDGSPSMKAGYYYRGATEHVLFCVRGSLRLIGEAEPTVFFAPRLPHSVKPPCFYAIVERQSPPPYLELFARPITPMFPKIEGWHVFGNEVDSDVALSTSPES